MFEMIVNLYDKKGKELASKSITGKTIDEIKNKEESTILGLAKSIELSGDMIVETTIVTADEEYVDFDEAIINVSNDFLNYKIIV